MTKIRSNPKDFILISVMKKLLYWTNSSFRLKRTNEFIGFMEIRLSPQVSNQRGYILQQELSAQNSDPHLLTIRKRTNNNKLAHGVYRKKTHTDRYLNAASHHHPQQKRSLIKTLVHRAETICDNESRPEEFKQIKEAVTKNVKKIQQVLPSNKDPVPRLLTKGVYELKCTCGKNYIGQTGRSIQCRIKEHQGHTRLGNTDKSAIAEHVHTNENHKIDYENIRVLDKTTRYYPRIIRESLEIMKNNNNFNREDGYRLSNTWRLAIPRTSDLECHGQPSSTDVWDHTETTWLSGRPARAAINPRDPQVGIGGGATAVSVSAVVGGQRKITCLPDGDIMAL
ncbi:hypothetical protein NQ318_019012 [Aromia moschata]|uniref:Helix-turn-helix domain-containing protein n=1 Tax=Aromia moschata TaxID=1265417 RepID=A0AAV8XIL0_9CUCU|nr:hypothetical protein NQ318_019012 [Aromia moschata]